MKKSLLLLGFLMIGLFLAQKSLAFAIHDNFENTATGQAGTNDKWVFDASTTWQITTSQAYQSAKSLQGGLADNFSPKFNNFSTSTIGTLNFDLYIASSTNYNLGLTTDYTGSANFSMLYIECNSAWYGADECAFSLVWGAEAIKTVRIKIQDWAHIQWDIDFTTGKQAADLYQDGEHHGYSNVPLDSDPPQYISNIYWGAFHSENFYIDNVAWVSPAPPYSYSFLWDQSGFSSEYPYGCLYNQVATSSTSNITFPIVFHFTNTASSTIAYNQIRVNFYEGLTLASSTLFSTSTINPGTQVTFSGDITLPAKTYRVEYEADGYDINSGAEVPPLISGGSSVNGDICSQTFVGYVTKSLVSTSSFQAGYLACQDFYNNCIASSTSILENLVCKAQGLAISLICPDQNTLAKAQGIITDIKSRMPLNYALAVKNSFSDWGTNASTATDTATSSFLQANISGISGLNQLSFFSVLRTILAALCIIPTAVFLAKKGAEQFFS